MWGYNKPEKRRQGRPKKGEEKKEGEIKKLIVHSIKEPDLCESEPTPTVMRQIMGAFAEYEKSMIKLRMLTKRKQNVARGLPSAGIKATWGRRGGWDDEHHSNGDFEIDEEKEALLKSVVRRMLKREITTVEAAKEVGLGYPYFCGHFIQKGCGTVKSVKFRDEAEPIEIEVPSLTS